MASRYDDFPDYEDEYYGYGGGNDDYETRAWGDMVGEYDAYPQEDYADDYETYDESGEGLYDVDVRRETRRPAREKAGRKGGKSSAGNRRGKSASTGRRGSSGSTGRSNGRKRKKKKGGSPIAAVILMILVLVIAFGAKLFLDRYSYSRETADLAEQFAIQGEDDVPIIWGDTLSEIRAKRIDGVDYMALDDVKSGLNSRFYYGVQNAADTTGMILYCLPTTKLQVQIGSQEVLADDGSSQMYSYIPARNVDGVIYLALDFVKEYTNFTMTAFENPHRLQIDTEGGTKTVATIARKTQIRTSGGIKSPVEEQLEKGATVTVLEQMENWSKVKSEDSIIGYVENRRLTDIQSVEQTLASDYTEPEFTHISVDGKINMAFHNVWGSAGNSTLTSYMSQTKSVNVVAPTWYWVSDNDGNMDKAGTADYVNQAHNLGCQVWAVVDNINSSTLTDNHTFLTTLDARTNLIGQLLQEASSCGFEGINVDFELIPEENGEDYIEFIRELSIACRNAGIILSVDNYPSYNFNSHYHLEEQGIFVDYEVVMGYDEHYAGSQEPGSVASISYVTEGIQMALEKGIDKDRLINAIPFYTRVWKTQNGSVSSEALGMQQVQDYMQTKGMTASWDAQTGQNYAETTDTDGTRIQIWIEDTQSIQQKLDVMQGYGIKGVAEWKLQYETSDIWDVISNYMTS